MYITYRESKVTGYVGEGEKRHRVTEEFIHRAEQDPILLAARRNHEMAQATSYTVESGTAFRRWVDVPGHRDKGSIPRMGGTAEYDF